MPERIIERAKRLPRNAFIIECDKTEKQNEPPDAGCTGRLILFQAAWAARDQKIDAGPRCRASESRAVPGLTKWQHRQYARQARAALLVALK